LGLELAAVGFTGWMICEKCWIVTALLLLHHCYYYYYYYYY